jgi:hypothetical protein
MDEYVNDNNNNGQNDADHKKFFIETVARFCDKCGRAYEVDDVEILQQTDYSVIIHFACSNCKARHLATFIKPLGITSRVPVNTDLSIEELSRFAGRRSVSANDVLDVHALLKNDDLTVSDILK